MIFHCGGEAAAMKNHFFTLVADFVADAGGRYVFPGIHGGYACFDDTINRIQAGRELGAGGQAIFGWPGELPGLLGRTGAPGLPGTGPAPTVAVKL